MLFIEPWSVLFPEMSRVKSLTTAKTHGDVARMTRRPPLRAPLKHWFTSARCLCGRFGLFFTILDDKVYLRLQPCITLFEFFNNYLNIFVAIDEFSLSIAVKLRREGEREVM